MIEKREPPADRLSRLGLSVIACILILAAILNYFSAYSFLGFKRADGLADDTIKLVGLAVVTIILLKSGALTKLVLGNYSAEFGDKNNDLVVRVSNLESSLAALEIPKDNVSPSPDRWKSLIGGERKAPENDRNKYQFGERAERDGYKLSAAFSYKSKSDKYVQVSLKVRRIEGGVLKDNVLFFLHQSFGNNDKARVVPRDGAAELNLFISGGFTVGAWIEGTEVLLELDLAEMPDAPDVVRNV